MTSECMYKEDNVLISDKRATRLDVRESGDLIIDLRDQTVIAFGPSPEVPNNKDYTQLRKKVYDKLVRAQRNLTDGLKLCVYEGYRSLWLQDKLFQTRFETIKEEYPNWTRDEIFIETTRLVSPLQTLEGTTNIPPHSTGAAVDVYLVDGDGKMVDMGLAVRDWMKDTDGSKSKTNSDKISGKAIENRKIMTKALEKEGFVNYPTEYWHWSYGDKYWAFMTNAPYAIFDSIKS